MINEKNKQVIKHVEVPQVQFPNKVDEMPVAVQRQIPMVQTVQKTMEIPQLQCIDKVVDDPVVQVPHFQVVEKKVGIPQLQIVEKTAETPQTQTVQGTRTSESLGNAPVRQVAQAETVKVDKMGAPVPTESALPMFVSTPVLETPPGVVEYVQIAAECVAHARAMTYAHAAPVVEYMTPASAVVHAALVTTMTVAPTAFTADTLPGDCSQGTIAAGSFRCSRTSCACPLPPAMTQKAAPAMAQRQVPSAPRVQKIVEMPKVQFSER